MADIFLSYAREDRERITAIQAALEALGLSLFVDVDGGVQAGDSFPQRISDAVMRSKAVIACWTPHALTRPWCRRECLLALEAQKLVPVALAQLAASDLKEFIDVSYEDLTDYTGQSQHFGWSQLLRSLARAVEGWAERHPGDAEATFALAARLKHAALNARPPMEASGAATAPRIELWAKLQLTTDVERLKRFAESFPGTTEAFDARELIAAIDDYARINQNFSLKYVDTPQKFQEQLENDAVTAERAIAELDRLFETPEAFQFIGPGGEITEYFRQEHELRKPFYAQRDLLDRYRRRWPAYREALVAFLARWRVIPERGNIAARIAGIDAMDERLSVGITRVAALLNRQSEESHAAYERYRLDEEESNRRAKEELLRYQEEQDREDEAWAAEHQAEEESRRQQKAVAAQKKSEDSFVQGNAFLATAVLTVATLMSPPRMPDSNILFAILGYLMLYGIASFFISGVLYGFLRMLFRSAAVLPYRIVFYTGVFVAAVLLYQVRT
ncbi:MAG: hypothetical protein DCF16_18550 [Alphaproteobacteria bacterium]|nr:MAG: hypothetical protein DCF16_18550 [Alphaproteobacteria bacterium]